MQVIFECGDVHGVMWNGAPRCVGVIDVNYGVM